MAGNDDLREQRLTEALRENLKRRKAQSRELSGQPAVIDGRLDEALELLVGADPRRGATLVEECAAKGDLRAVERLAVFEAMGLLRPLNWDAALDRLAEAAEQGSRPARGQLLVMAEDRLPSSDDLEGGRDWGAVRAAISVASKLQPPPGETISFRPLLRNHAGFASAAECAWLIERARDRLHRAYVTLPTTGKEAEEAGRTNRSAFFSVAATDCVIEMVRARLANAIGVPVPCFEVPQVLHYAPGQEFKLHYDYLDPNAQGFRDEVARNGQRIATVLLYLNDGFEGGQTQFPEIGIDYKGGTGDLLLFSNVDPSGRPDPATAHSGLPPTSGEKWLLSQWVREHPAGMGDQL